MSRYRSLTPPIVAVLLSVMTLSAADQQKHQRNDGTENAHTPTGKPVLWHDPGAVEQLDFAGGVGGRDAAPKAPFTFEQENLRGSNPKVRVADANGVRWSVKFGDEVKAETFSTRIAWAVGYFVEADYFVPEGTIDGVGPLTRAKHAIQADGSFRNARFKMHSENGVRELRDEDSWTWVQNPFLGTKELNSLKIIVMLVSNWDNKDVRDIKRGSNTAIYQYPDGEAHYLITDWGASMGKWGGYIGRDKWDCKGYQQQTPELLKGVKGDDLVWGYSGQHTADFREGITVSDLRWVLQYLGRITDDQFRAGLEASGATPGERDCFTKSVRARVDRMKACADGATDSSTSCH